MQMVSCEHFNRSFEISFKKSGNFCKLWIHGFQLTFKKIRINSSWLVKITSSDHFYDNLDHLSKYIQRKLSDAKFLKAFLPFKASRKFIFQRINRFLKKASKFYFTKLGKFYFLKKLQKYLSFKILNFSNNFCTTQII